MIGENFFARGDGTRAFYFSRDCLEELFAARGFTAVYVRTQEVEIANKKEELRMERKWIQAVFRLDCND